MDRIPAYSTSRGAAYCGNSLEIMKSLSNDSIDLAFTSPPYALHFKKEYGNANQNEYVDWIVPFCTEIKRILKKSGSFVLNIGGAWTPGKPERSLYIYKLVIKLCEEIGFHLAQEFFWYNPAKIPAPAEWVNVRRIRVKDSVEYLFWFSKTPFPKANNLNILQEYSPDMKRLIVRGIKNTQRPSGHLIKGSFAENKGGSIPPNLIEAGNNESNSGYIKACKQLGQKVHPARFPSVLPEYFIKFLTDPDDVVLDPFAGSNTTGRVAENLQRRWIAIELSEDYVNNSRLRFVNQPDDEKEVAELELFSNLLSM